MSKRILKALYYTRLHEGRSTNIGALNKCKEQVLAFRDQGVVIDLLTYANTGVKLNGQVIVKLKFGNLVQDYSKFLLVWDKSLLEVIDFGCYDFVYLRYPLCHPMLLYFFAKLKQRNPDIKLILEFPTFPYLLELQKKDVFYRAAALMDRVLRRYLYKWTDLAIHYGVGKILDLPTLNLTNGIDLKDTQLREEGRIRDSIKIVALGSWNYWHGIDRLLQGLATFYQHDHEALPLEIKIIGDGPALADWQLLTQKLQLKPRPLFLPTIYGKELNKHLMEADIAIGSLGMFRKEVYIDSSLKHRAYCARSIPFVLATNDPDFPSALPFIHYVSANDTPLDIHQVLIWFYQLKTEMPDYQREMRDYAIEYLSWHPRIKKVLEWIKV